jgi:hypothetical protein
MTVITKELLLLNGFISTTKNTYELEIQEQIKLSVSILDDANLIQVIEEYSDIDDDDDYEIVTLHEDSLYPVDRLSALFFALTNKIFRYDV